MTFKEREFIKELEEYGLGLLDDPKHNKTGAIHMFGKIRDLALDKRHLHADAIVRLCAEGAWMCERMLRKIKEYNPAYEDFTSFKGQAAKRMHLRSPNRTICQVVSFIAIKYSEPGADLYNLCAQTIYITKSYHTELSSHNTNYDGRNSANSAWQKKDKTFGK